ncbi:MAG TPA: nicotinate-nucleotide adenylyltransferase [Xanthobacteraceae bacterium]|nr:nicotinate-nucleotide adenylyltransferase [Xanthobacteraceae bacterium]
MIKIPPHAPGLKIGLLGGSFNPPHDAHRAISLFALKRLGLDRVWWLVTPGNPLKDTRKLPPLFERVAAARHVARSGRIDVSGIEALIGTHYTYETLAWLKRHVPSVHFVWIMGADNLASFHRWKNWRGIARLVPIAVIDRFGASLRAPATPAAQTLARKRLPETTARHLPRSSPPAWIYLHGLKSPLSSTQLRTRATV